MRLLIVLLAALMVGCAAKSRRPKRTITFQDVPAQNGNPAKRKMTYAGPGGFLWRIEEEKRGATWVRTDQRIVGKWER
jgi:hypothetical protein